jgi:hypothetical protein
MTAEYPNRPMAPKLVRFVCMIFGCACIVGAVTQGIQHDAFELISGLVVGGVWFAFGAYGGLPLIGTSGEWHSTGDFSAVAQSHKDGLIVMRRRRRIMWLALPSALLASVLIMPALQHLGRPEMVVFLLGIPLVFLNFRYYLSKVPSVRFRVLHQV